MSCLKSLLPQSSSATYPVFSKPLMKWEGIERYDKDTAIKKAAYVIYQGNQNRLAYFLTQRRNSSAKGGHEALSASISITETRQAVAFQDRNSLRPGPE